MTGGGSDEIAALLGQDPGDALSIVAAQRFAGKDNDAGVDHIRRNTGGGVSIIDDDAELLIVDALFALIGCERHRRLKQGLARNDVITAGQIFGETPQADAGKNDLGAGRADIDADRGQRHIVLAPQRVVFQRPVVAVEIVIVIGIIGVGVNDVAAIKMIGERVGRFLVVIFGHA